ncbi:Short chain dehydrogenase [Pyrenophora tritici-repentis]|nr:Short chain dehydrogenase [Pyrenophora tritici-repentis]KAF7449071.1 Short chain dehydrogenase [Pyrenophora tritici-repentis]KAI1566349.1 FabG Dehydrogenase with different specificities related to short-chain alcohol dehydrogenase [Pyrenophora tritici-repentis]KAI1586157.1 FabG Dehydrogenase with different specificities related to short-chain alcohol dehydrogenase [Pyrenophora tritici-repentis]KAI1599443.1 FabG Dehydrogenase with different specificities related to short-chain alcohol dehydro
MSSARYSSMLAKCRVLVLGGSSGIGFSVAEHALSLGAIVTISSSRQAKLDKALERLRASVPESSASVDGIVCDLSDLDSMRPNLEQLLKSVTATQLLDHIVYTAGDGIKIRPVSELEVPEIQRMGHVRFFGPMLLGGLAKAYMKPSKASSITLTSGVNIQKPGKGWTAVAGYGGGTEGIAKGLAVDLAPIRVNTVSPGAVHTELFDGIPQDRLPAVLSSFRKSSLTDSVGTPEELSEAYIYLMRV